ncbi:hypothetical protein ASD65_00300 [Microbacterium sp. Root61]|uniref:type II secretion system protein n=1 Tax=Microbacterium sp. Root61 TaxID=1736570 RepID=UPI0006F36E28|nr:type II secretion system protein [Microbacterium sp. Root61]KRA23030.1 hypothetical protein ASD65_00300 [Microbacterium sp. Root61]
MTRASDTNDDGFGLVEVIVAIFILGLLAVAILPLIWTGLRVATEQSAVAGATHATSGFIDEVRSRADGGCSALNGTSSFTTDRGDDILITGVVDAACNDTLRPLAVKYTATATNGDGDVLAAVETLIFLPKPPGETP